MAARKSGSVPVFFIVILSAWTLMHGYVLWRIAGLPAVEQHVPRAAIIVVGIVLWLGYVLARVLDRLGATWLARPLEWLGANWVGVLFLLCVALLAADVVSGFGYLLPRAAPALRAWALAAAGVLAVIAMVQAARAPVVREYEVRLAGLPAQLDGTSLVVISDTHVGTMLGERWLKARVAQVQALRPDAVILAGDILEGDDDNVESKLLPQIGRLEAPLGVWAVTGNHESYMGGVRAVSLLQSAGVKVLRDRWVELKPGLVLAGVDDLTSRRRRGEVGDFVVTALAGHPTKAATVLVSHTPWEMERAAEAGAGLMLSAHTHNGQIWPFNYVVRAIYPTLGGRYDVRGMALIVCRGTGTWGPRMRLWGRGEMVRVRLRTLQN